MEYPDRQTDRHHYHFAMEIKKRNTKLERFWKQEQPKNHYHIETNVFHCMKKNFKQQEDVLATY